MAHPYASQAKASEKRRLGRLGAKAGKSFGSTSMYKKTSYPAKNAGTSRELTISGGSAKKRADRPANHFAFGGTVGGSKAKKKGHSTTNIIIASPGGGGAAGPRPVPVPVPVNRPVPVPVGGAGGLPPPRPPMGPPGAGGPPVNVNVPPPAAAGPVGPPPMPAIRPPGMAAGGSVGSTYHNWGKGFKDGGHVKKKANGGPLAGGLGAAGAPPGRRPFAPAPVPGQGPMPGKPMIGKPGGPGIRGPGYKKGGEVHDDEAQDKKLFARMMKGKKYAGGGKVTYHEDGDEVTGDPEPQASSTSVSAPAADASKSSLSGVMKGLTGLGKSLSPTSPAGTTDYATKAANAAASAAEKAGQAAAGSTQSLMRANQSAGFKPGAVPGAAGAGSKFQFKKGGSVKKVGAATGLARLRDSKVAAKLPAKTEI